MRKRITALLLACTLLGELLPVIIWAAPIGQQPQLISTAEEFAAMDPAGCYRLTEDVTVTQPFAAAFTGSLDGGGHTVTLSLTAQEDTTSLALFPEADGASFENLTLAGSVSADEDSGLSEAAALIGIARGDVTVTACKNQTVLDVGASYCTLGGLVAVQLTGELTLTGCANTGRIDGPQAAFTGGLVGRQEPYAALTMQACYQAADITGGGEEGLCAGGLIGSVAGTAAIFGCWSAASPEDHSAGLAAWGRQWTVSAGTGGALCGVVDSGASLTGARCFWIAVPVGSDDGFQLPDSGLFPEYDAAHREALLDALYISGLPDGCTFFLPSETGWPLLRWEQPLTEEEQLAAARRSAEEETETAYTDAVRRVQECLAAVTERTGLWYELYDAATRAAEEAMEALTRQRTEALSALKACRTIEELQACTAEGRAAMEETAAGMETAAGSTGVPEEKQWDGVTLLVPVGSGTAADPYQISAGAELAWFAARVNGGSTGLCARITEPLDLNDMPWTPIGSTTGVDTTDGYCGTFDGGGFVIHGLSAADSGGLRSYTGLFGTMADGGIVQNVRLSGSITCAQTDSGGNRILNYGAGGIAGRSSGVIYCCETSVQITDSGGRPAVHTGGIVGQLSGTGIVDGCISYGTISGDLSYAGGIAGTVRQNAIVRYCRSEGIVSGLRSVGGIAGFLTGTAQIRECENRAAVSGTIGVGGIAGRLDKDSHISDELDVVVSHVYNCAAVSGSSGNACGTGGIAGWVGAVENGTYTGTADLSYLYNSGTVTGGGSTSGTACGGLIGNWKTGSVTHSGNSSANRLWGVAETLGTTAEDTVQTASLTPDVSKNGARWDKTTASRTLLVRRITTADARYAVYGQEQSAVYNRILLTFLREVELSASAAETEALLADCDVQLAAVLTGVAAAGAQLLADMQAYADSRLYGPEDAVQVQSLLAQAAQDAAACATLRDVTLLRQTYLGTDRLDGLLQRIPTYPDRMGQELYNAFIYRKQYTQEDMAALLCAYEDWCLQMQSASTVQAVDALYADARQALSELAFSFQQTDTVPDMDAAAAQALELARSRARRCLEELVDSRVAQLGALAGDITRYPAARQQQLTAALRYSASAIRAASEMDFAPLTTHAAVAQVLEQASADVETAYAAACVRVRRLLDSRGDWDGVQICRPEGAGTDGDPYRIGTAEELAWLAQAVEEGQTDLHAVLTADIDLGCQPWPVIGGSRPFSGRLDGQGHTVSGLYIADPEDRTALGLLGAAENAVLCHITVSGTIDLAGLELTGTAEPLSVGGLLGRADGGVTIDGCTAQVEISISMTNAAGNQSAALGGIAGRLTGDEEHHLTECRNEGTLTVTLAPGSRYLGGSGQGGLGGITGSISAAAALERCVNTGNITVNRAAGVGGIVGRLDSGGAAVTVTQCANQGEVSNDTAGSLLRRGGTGGIAGLAVSGAVTIDRCYNTGTLSGTTIVGGILGGESGDYAASIPSYTGNAALTVQNCYNAGKLVAGTAAQRVGALAGYPLDGCYRDGLTVLTGTAEARLGWRSSQGDSVREQETLPEDMFPGLVRSIGGLNRGFPLFDWELLTSRSRETVIAWLWEYYTRYTEPYASVAQRQELEQLLAGTAAAIRQAAAAVDVVDAYDAAMEQLASPELLTQAIAAARTRLAERCKAACKAYPYAGDALRALYEKQRSALTACTTAADTDTVLDGFEAGVVDCLLLHMDGVSMKLLQERLPAVEDAAAALTDVQRGMLLYYGRLPELQALLALYVQNVEKLTQWQKEDRKAYPDLAAGLAELADTARQALDDAVSAEKMTAALDGYCAGVVEQLILAIGPLPELLTQEEAALYQSHILRAQAAYDRLSDAQRALVPNLEDLQAAQARYRQFEQDLAAAKRVEALIAAIGNVTADSLTAIQRAQTAYDALTPAQRILVSPAMLTTLQTAWVQYQELLTQPPAEEDTSAAAPETPPAAILPEVRPFDWSLVWMSLGIAACAFVILFAGTWFAGARRAARRKAGSKEWYS